MSVRGFHFFPILFLLLFNFSGSANADPIVVFNNFGPGDTFDVGIRNRSAWFGVFPGPFFLGFSFTLTQDSILHDVTVAISSGPGDSLVSGTPALAVTLQVWNTDENGRPATVQEELRVAGLTPFGEPFSPLTATLTSGGGPLFRGSYWLTASTESGVAVWNFNSIGHVGPIISTEEDNECCFLEDGQTGAFRVTASPLEAPTPEPGTILLLAAGLLIPLRRIIH